MSSEPDEKIIIGSPSKGIPAALLPLFFHPGSKQFMATVCDHEVALAPAGQEAFATGEYGLICSDCVESYSILRGGTQEHVMLPGAREELEEQFGVEETQKIIDAAKPELERRVGTPLNTGEEKQ